MDRVNLLVLLGAGAAIWAGGTIYFGYRGHVILETSPQRYWATFAILPVVSAALCIALLYWRRIAPADWATGMLLLAIPGMFGEAIALSNFATFLPRLQLGSAGRYGALLFATYALVLSIGEIVSLRNR
jgi:uncharacterized protein DUF5367